MGFDQIVEERRNSSLRISQASSVKPIDGKARYLDGMDGGDD